MKIEKRGIRITEVPGVDYIEGVPGGNVTIQFSGGAYLATWPAEGARELRDALAEALGLDSLKGPWYRFEEIPQSVPAVLDKDGDQWRRVDNGVFESVGSALPQEGMNVYAPFETL